MRTTRIAVLITLGVILTSAAAMAATYSLPSYNWNGSTAPSIYSGLGSGADFKGMDGGYFRVAYDHGNPTGWDGNQFENSYMVQNNEAVSGSITFKVDAQENGNINGAPTGGSYLYMFNMGFANGLNSFLSIVPTQNASHVASGWYEGGHPEYGKWEMNPDVVDQWAPEGKVYIMNTFTAENPTFQLVDLGSDHTVSWNAYYDAATDKVVTDSYFDGSFWGSYKTGRNHNNLGWTENRMPKRHGRMSGMAMDYSIDQVNWNTAAVPEPSSLLALVPGLLGVLAYRRRK